MDTVWGISWRSMGQMLFEVREYSMQYCLWPQRKSGSKTAVLQQGSNLSILLAARFTVLDRGIQTRPLRTLGGLLKPSSEAR